MEKPVKVAVVFLYTVFFVLLLSCNTASNPQEKEEVMKDTDNSAEDDGENLENDQDIVVDEVGIPEENEPSKGIIPKIQKGEIAVNTEVLFDCVITAIVYDQDSRYNNVSIRGFYVSELIPSALPYSGIYVFMKNSAEIGAFSPGDHIEVNGFYREYFGRSQVEVTSYSVTKLGVATMPEPAEISSPSKVSTPFIEDGAGWTPGPVHGMDARKYQSVLIEVKDVEITNPNLGYGAFEITGNLAVDKQIYYYEKKRDTGKKFDSVKGILIYAYDAYRIAPRKIEDLIEKEEELLLPDNDEEQERSDSDSDIEEGIISKIQKGEIEVNSEVSFESIVTAIVYNRNTHYEKTSIKGLYVSEVVNQAVPYSGIYVFVYGTAGLNEFAVGDHLELKGTYKRFYGSSQIEAVKADIIKVGTAAVPEPAFIDDPSKVSTPFFREGENWIPGADNGEDAEKYEGVLIKVQDVEITNSNLGYGAFEITGHLAVDRQIHYYEGSRNKGTDFNFITGILIYSYGAFRIAPRNEEDLQRKE